MAYLGEEIKKLGFGLMRLPKNGDAIDVEQTKTMVDKFMAAGFTYFDTAWAYPGSEEAIRAALVKRYPRESYRLATKNAAWIECKTREEAVSQFNTSLERTGAGYFDFYLLHNLGEHRTKFFDDFDMWSFVQEEKAEGLIRHAGFSFHSTPEELEEILDAHPEMEFVQLQINYADWENPAVQSRRCYEVARKHGKPVIIMEPVKGGMLATPPEKVREVFEKAAPKASVASWAVRFAASLDGVITVLSGMSSVEQMDDNLYYMKDFQAARRAGAGRNRSRARRTCEIPRHSMHNLQLLREGLPAERRHIGDLHGDELPHPLRQQRGGQSSGKLAHGRTRQKTRRRVRQMRPLRRGLPAAHKNPRRTRTRGESLRSSRRGESVNDGLKQAQRKRGLRRSDPTEPSFIFISFPFPLPPITRPFPDTSTTRAF